MKKNKTPNFSSRKHMAVDNLYSGKALVSDYAIDKKTEEVIAVSGNSDFTAEELGLEIIGNNREYYVVKVVNTHSKTKWR